MRGIRRKGQAWIVYESAESSQTALDNLNGQIFQGKQLEIAFSKNESHATLMRKGFPIKRRVSEPSDDTEPKRSRGLPTVDSFFSNERQDRSAATGTSSKAYSRPNRTLLVENLPENFSTSELEGLFKVYTGFVEVRPIPGRGMAFVEFTDDHRSQVALNKLNGYQLKSGSQISVSNCRD